MTGLELAGLQKTWLEGTRHLEVSGMMPRHPEANRVRPRHLEASGTRPRHLEMSWIILGGTAKMGLGASDVALLGQAVWDLGGEVLSGMGAWGEAKANTSSKSTAEVKKAPARSGSGGSG